MIEIGEKCASGIRKVFADEKHVGDIVKTDTQQWLAIPNPTGAGNVDLRVTAHKLRRDAISTLTE